MTLRPLPITERSCGMKDTRCAVVRFHDHMILLQRNTLRVTRPPCGYVLAKKDEISWAMASTKKPLTVRKPDEIVLENQIIVNQ